MNAFNYTETDNVPIFAWSKAMPIEDEAKAKKRFTPEDHAHATEGVEYRKGAGAIDETPMAYKDIDAVMAAQDDLVDVVRTLKLVVCVRG